MSTSSCLCVQLHVGFPIWELGRRGRADNARESTCQHSECVWEGEKTRQGTSYHVISEWGLRLRGAFLPNLPIVSNPDWHWFWLSLSHLDPESLDRNLSLLAYKQYQKELGCKWWFQIKGLFLCFLTWLMGFLTKSVLLPLHLGASVCSVQFFEL